MTPEKIIQRLQRLRVAEERPRGVTSGEHLLNLQALDQAIALLSAEQDEPASPSSLSVEQAHHPYSETECPYGVLQGAVDALIDASGYCRWEDWFPKLDALIVAAVRANRDQGELRTVITMTSEQIRKVFDQVRPREVEVAAPPQVEE